VDTRTIQRQSRPQMEAKLASLELPADDETGKGALVVVCTRDSLIRNIDARRWEWDPFGFVSFSPQKK